jgi:hypothetical protein
MEQKHEKHHLLAKDSDMRILTDSVKKIILPKNQRIVYDPDSDLKL